MWLTFEYQAVTLFSLKLSSATSSGGKTLLAPTPYAFKMALLDAACRTLGVERVQSLWPEIRDLALALSPARSVVVTNLFQKVLRPRRNSAAAGDPDAGYFLKTIGYREYAQLIGPLGIALGWPTEDERPWLEDLAMNIHYLGKRGGFVQLSGWPVCRAELPKGYYEATRDQQAFPIPGTLQAMDDCTPQLTFERANIYSSEKVRPDKDRIVRNIVLPYALRRSSKSFSHYERAD